jgi:hypothetical protein
MFVAFRRMRWQKSENIIGILKGVIHIVTHMRRIISDNETCPAVMAMVIMAEPRTRANLQISPDRHNLWILSKSPLFRSESQTAKTQSYAFLGMTRTGLRNDQVAEVQPVIMIRFHVLGMTLSVHIEAEMCRKTSTIWKSRAK